MSTSQWGVTAKRDIANAGGRFMLEPDAYRSEIGDRWLPGVVVRKMLRHPRVREQWGLETFESIAGCRLGPAGIRQRLCKLRG